ncbi:hypothetical protein [Type-E symbiont of Plautia stali]|uniref:hypothetical protein n=1 Tax=Type-E symbiont of Plautia stali TaxID=1560357 RepID=UPI00073EB780|nr:hypothetical protein [Type-E symbiont of Plautia stali]
MVITVGLPSYPPHLEKCIMSEKSNIQPADNSATAPALLRTCINPADIDLFQAAVFYRDPLLLKLFSLTPDDVQLKDQLAVMGKFNADRNAQRRHDQSKVNKQLKEQASTSSETVTPAKPTFMTHAPKPVQAVFFTTVKEAQSAA